MTDAPDRPDLNDGQPLPHPDELAWESERTRDREALLMRRMRRRSSDGDPNEPLPSDMPAKPPLVPKKPLEVVFVDAPDGRGCTTLLAASEDGRRVLEQGSNLDRNGLVVVRGGSTGSATAGGPGELPSLAGEQEGDDPRGDLPCD